MLDINIKIYRRDMSGVWMEFGSDEVVSYRVEDALTDGGLPLGAVSAKRFVLTVAQRKGIDPAALDGLRVRALLFDSRVPGTRREDSATWAPFGEWYIDRVEANQNAATAVIFGADALATRFEDSFTDSAGGYPRTLRNLVDLLCGAATGAQVSQSAFYNDGYVIRRMPPWPKNTSLRRALSCCAALAGGFVRISYGGEAQMVSCFGGEETALGPEEYVRFAREGGEAFHLNAINFRFEGDSDYTRFACREEEADSAANALSIECNPLMTRENLQALVEHLKGCGFAGGTAEWTGPGLIQSGDVLLVTDLDGSQHRLLITANRIQYDVHGLNIQSRCAMPSKGRGSAAFGRRVFNADGTVNFEAIGEVSKKVAALSGAYIGSLTAGDITANGLLAKFIEATRLRAASVSAQEVATDALTAALAEIVSLSVRKLDAGTLKTDELVTALVDAFSVRCEALSADSIESDRLAAALARFQVLAAGAAEFDRATVNHMIASALHVSYGVGGEVYIENLAADYAALLSANVGRLCVKAADGRYYELSVDGESGGVRALPASPSEGEIAAGLTNSGRTILETQISASALNASDLKAMRALVSRLDAARIDADTLVSRQAFIDSLNARDITANSYLRLALRGQEEKLRELTAETQSAQQALSDAEPLLENLKRWVTLDEEGLRQGKAGSVYSTLIDEGGFHILRRSSVQAVGAFDRRGLRAPGVSIGDIRASRTARGGWVWKEE